MSNQLDGKKCPVCNSYLFDDDDLVVCPVCGATHHRDCYDIVGHCALEEFHGTDKQYKAKSETTVDGDTQTSGQKCSRCGKQIDSGVAFCPYCGMAVDSRFQNHSATAFGTRGFDFSGFDLLGGVDGDEKVEDVSAAEMAKFVRANTHRYIPRFFNFARSGKKMSWNWTAFLLPQVWLFTRKMFKQAILVSMLMLAQLFCRLPFDFQYNRLANYLSDNGYKTREEVLNYIINHGSEHFDIFILLLAVVGFAIAIVVSVICGLYGDSWYMDKCISDIKTIKQNQDDSEQETGYVKKGGISLAWLIITITATTWLPSILIMLFS